MSDKKTRLFYRFSTTDILKFKRCCSEKTLSLEGTDSIRTSLGQMLDRAGKTRDFRRNWQVKGFPEGMSEHEQSCFRALLLVERIRLMYSSAGCEEQPSYKEYFHLLLQWSILYSENRAEKTAKYLSCNIFSYIMHQEELERIDLPFNWNSHTMGPNVWERFVHSLHLAKMTARKCYQAQSFLYLKKGAPVVSPSFIKESLKKHRAALATERVVPHFVTLKSGPEARVIMLRKQFKERVDLILKDLKLYSLPFPKKFWEPSPNASYGVSRSQGGQARLLHFKTKKKSWFELADANGHIVKLPIVKPLVSLEFKNRCTAVPIVEPFKVRVITKGPPNSSYCLKGLQLALWSRMAQHPIFELIGRTIAWSDIPTLKNGEKWLSGDFSQATDLLARWVSEYIGYRLAWELDLPEDLIVDSLCNNTIDYGDWEDSDLQPFLQKNGQLMGSVLSFLVLCIANAALLWIVKDPDGEQAFREQRFVVNGDDSLCPMTEDEKDSWYEIAPALGLVPSIGKTYYSNLFCIANSTLFFIRHDDVVEKVPFLNGDLFQPLQGKGAEPRKAEDLAPLQGMLNSCDNFSVHSDTLDLFIKCHKTVLRQFNGSWTVPKFCGGLGLEVPERMKHPWSEDDWARAYQNLRYGKSFVLAKKLKHLNQCIVGKSRYLAYYRDIIGEPEVTFVLDERPVNPNEDAVVGLNSIYAWAEKGILRRDSLFPLEPNERVRKCCRGRTATDWQKLLIKLSADKFIAKYQLARKVLVDPIDFWDLHKQFEVSNPLDKRDIQEILLLELSRCSLSVSRQTSFSPEIPLFLSEQTLLGRKGRYRNWVWKLWDERKSLMDSNKSMG